MLDVAGVRRLLPHGHPIVLVDRVVDIDPGRSIVATKAVTAGEPCFATLGRDVCGDGYAYPASLLLESFGQAAAILWLHGLAPGACAGRVLMLVAGRDCRIEGRALPGDVLRHVARIDHVVGDNVFVEGETYVDDRRVATVGSMMASMRDRSEVDPCQHRVEGPNE
jgi:3-hydroxyacyl-[acyl-carrier-protein] dehydratase